MGRTPQRRAPMNHTSFRSTLPYVALASLLGLSSTLLAHETKRPGGQAPPGAVTTRSPSTRPGDHGSARAGTSPWGKADQIGTLNMMTERSQLAVLQRIGSGKVYDLSVE